MFKTLPLSLILISLAAAVIPPCRGEDKSKVNKSEVSVKPSPANLESWQRPHFKSGGGDAFLFYVVYGSIDSKAALSRSAYRCAGIPEGLEVSSYGPAVHPEVVDSFRSGYPWDVLKKSEPGLAMNISAQESCLVLKGAFRDPKDLNYLRDTVGLITHFFDHGGVAVYDPQMLKWWSRKEWRERIFDPAGAVPRHHSVILVSADESGTDWIYTRGLRKFGRPDISIRRVPSQFKEAAIDLCNRFIELQAFGGIVPEGQEIKTAKLPSGLKCYHRGSLEDPEFNNAHLEIE